MTAVLRLEELSHIYGRGTPFEKIARRQHIA
jgi:hypothetical protein